MAEQSTVQIKSYLKWCTILPRGPSVLSPVFEVQGAECRLRVFLLLHSPACAHARYGIEMEPAGSTHFLRSILMRIGPCDEAYSPFFHGTYYTPVVLNPRDCRRGFDGEKNTPVTFIIDFRSDVKPKSGIPKPDKKRIQSVSETIQTLCLKALSQDFSKMLENSSDHDVVLRCHDRTVKAHRIVLMSRSKVFEGMLRSDMVEGQTGRVEVKDMDAEVFLELVKYLYTGTLTKLSEDRAKRLYEAGDRYAVKNLMQRCSAFLIENLTNENACDILEVAETHYDLVFKEIVIAYILKNKIPLMDQVWKPFSARCPLVAVDILNRFIKLQATA